MSMKRLLCILSNMNAGGAETFLMKIYRKLDRQEYQMDFCINTPDPCFYEKEISELGGMVFRIPAKSEGVYRFSKALYDVIKNYNYKYVLRITSNAAGFLDLMIAKKAGAEICSARSSNSSDGNSWKANAIHKVCRVLLSRYVDVRIAPSDLAADYTFGDRKEVNILHNAIDLDVYHYSTEGRARIRDFYGLKDDSIVIGHVGRFMSQKNHAFLLEIFKRLYERNRAYRLLLIGEGELEAELRNRVHELGIENAVIFGGIRNDIPDVLSAMDMFVFPSLYEGMPNTVIEAQAAGLPCVISDTITREANITGLVYYLPLGNAEYWAGYVEKMFSANRTNTKTQFYEHQYDIDSQTKAFTRYVFGE